MSLVADQEIEDSQCCSRGSHQKEETLVEFVAVAASAVNRKRGSILSQFPSRFIVRMPVYMEWGQDS